MDPLTGKVAVVTGGSRGIGLATARAFLSRGASVLIAGTQPQSVAEAARSLEASARGGSVIAHVADVRVQADVERMLKTAAERLGGIDILVNNAGVGVFAPVSEMSLEQWHAVIETNLTGVFHCCHGALPYLRRRGGGWIVNISSLASTSPFAGGAAYCASKAGLNAFSEALMQEIRHDGIRVSHVLPGSVNTSFSGRQPTGQEWKLAPEDVAEVVMGLVAHPSRSHPSRVEIRPSRPPKKG